MSPDERKAIAALDRLARRWPRSLTLASMDGTLVVFATGDRFAADGIGLDPDKALYETTRIPNTGGGY